MFCRTIVEYGSYPLNGKGIGGGGLEKRRKRLAPNDIIVSACRTNFYQLLPGRHLDL